MSSSKSRLIAPYGGQLTDLVVSDDEREALFSEANRLPSLQLTSRSLCDLELLANGGFSPLDRFMGQADYQRVLQEMRLADGTLFPMPITLTADPAKLPAIGSRIALRDARNNLLAVMDIEEVFEWDPRVEAEMVFGTIDSRHPLVSEMGTWGPVCVSGALRVLNLPHSYDFADLRLTPTQVRARLDAMQADRVVAFQTRNPLHRAHEELTKRAVESIDGTLLLHPSVGMTKPGDVDHFSRVRIYRTLIEHYYDPQRTLLSLLPLAMRMGGPREAVWHSIIRRNFGASHFIVGRDHAGPGNDSAGKPFYGPYAAQEMVAAHAEEIGVQPLFFQEMVYLEDEDRYIERDKVPTGAKVISISGTQVRDEYLAKGKLLPSWFTRHETAEILAQVYPPRYQQGICVWFTGLSGAGKSTIAEILSTLLLEYGRQSTMLDGDVVRTHLSKGLGFSREDRDTNILRIGYVASEIVRHRGIAICAAVSPYRSTRDECRAMVGNGSFFEVFVDTPLEECERRDIKGMYAKARRGEIKNFTGIDDPYEPPLHPELRLTTVETTPEANAHVIIDFLMANGLLQEESAR
jgi:sulfate adenylyltransferase